MAGDRRSTAFEATGVVDQFNPARDLFEGGIGEQASRDAEAVRTARYAGDWEGMVDAGYEMHARGEHRVRKLLRTQQKVVAPTRDRSAPEDDPELPELDESQREELAGRFESLLAGPLRGLVPEDAELVEELVSGALPTGREPAEVPEGGDGAGFSRVLFDQRNYSIWYLASGYRAMAYGTVYAAYADGEAVDHPEEAVEEVAGAIEDIHQRGMDFLQQFYGNLAQADWEGLEASAWRAASYPVERLSDVEVLARMLRQTRRHHRTGDDTGDVARAIEAARLEVDLHECIHLLTLVLCASYKHLVVARQRGRGEEATEAVEAAREKHFHSLVAEGTAVELADLVAEPDRYDGELVAVEGFARDVHLSTSDGYGTKFWLVDERADETMEVFYPFRDLTESHLYEDAYVRLHGEFDAECEYADDPRDVHLDQVRVAEHGEDSWFDALVREFEENDVFELFPSRGKVLWSPELPPDDGGED